MGSPASEMDDGKFLMHYGVRVIQKKCSPRYFSHFVRVLGLVNDGKRLVCYNPRS